MCLLRLCLSMVVLAGRKSILTLPVASAVQFAFNTLSRVTPVSHGVCNVVKRVVIIGTSVVFFGNKLTDKTKMGTVIALIGTYLYTEATKRYKASHAPASPPKAA